MLMKKIFILLMVGSLLFSCQITDVLNQEPPHNLTPDNAITDEKSAETALTGIYGEQIGYESYMSIGNHAMTARYFAKKRQSRRGCEYLLYRKPFAGTESGGGGIYSFLGCF